MWVKDWKGFTDIGRGRGEWRNEGKIEGYRLCWIIKGGVVVFVRRNKVIEIQNHCSVGR